MYDGKAGCSTGEVQMPKSVWGAAPLGSVSDDPWQSQLDDFIFDLNHLRCSIS